MELPLVRVARRWGLTWRVAVPTLLAAVLGVGSVAPLGGTLRPTPGVVLAAGCYLGGLLSLAVAAGSYARYRRAMATATTPTGAVEPGFVEVSGEAGPAGDPATTPFTGAAALCYEWRVEERRGDGWATVALDEDGAPFRVDDGSGPALVDPAGADRRFDEERRVEVAADEAPPERVAAFLATHPDLAAPERDRRYVERFLPPGAEVYVLGQARPASTRRTSWSRASAPAPTSWRRGRPRR